MAEWYRHIKSIPAPYYQKICEDFEKHLGGTPDQAPEAYNQISPTAHVFRIKCPVLILHGDDDKEVPVSHAHILARAIEKAGGQSQLEIFKNAGHGLRSPEAHQKMDHLVLDFLKKQFQNRSHSFKGPGNHS
jgi:dipeptidyl aminopeptidase/acylaminoacyl peptidase